MELAAEPPVAVGGEDPDVEEGALRRFAAEGLRQRDADLLAVEQRGAPRRPVEALPGVLQQLTPLPFRVARPLVYGRLALRGLLEADPELPFSEIVEPAPTERAVELPEVAEFATDEEPGERDLASRREQVAVPGLVGVTPGREDAEAYPAQRPAQSSERSPQPLRR